MCTACAEGCHDTRAVVTKCSDDVCRHVLNNRSDLCRARHDSGMRDAEDNQLHVPEHFAKVCLHTHPPPPPPPPPTRGGGGGGKG